MPRKQRKTQKKTNSAHIAILLPTGGSPEIEFIHSLLEFVKMLNQGNIQYTTMILRGSCIHVNREKLVEDVLKTLPTATHVLFIDDDMEFTPKAVVELFKTGEPFVGVTYRKRQEKMDWTALGTDGMKVQADGVTEGTVDCVSMGFGLTLIAVDVFKNLKQPWFTPFWDEDIKDYRGEDESLCFLAAHAGIQPKISLSASNLVGHIGTTRFDHSSFYDGIADGCVERKVTPKAA